MTADSLFQPWSVHSVVPAMVWPGLPAAARTQTLAMLFQLEQTQWLAPDALRDHQNRQIALLLRHAFETCPYYRRHWGALFDPSVPLTQDRFEALPLLARRDLRVSYTDIASQTLPSGQQIVGEIRTSGSTGTPVKVRRTQFESLMWNTLTLRDHLWHRRDLSATLAAIRSGVKRGITASWGSATEGLVDTGPATLLDLSASVDEQLDWLAQQRAAYLISYPSNLAELARASMRRGIALPDLREVRSFGEMLPSELRSLCREAWGVNLVDVYSANETGYLALQCPQHEHYHVQSEAVLLEVLDNAGRACGPGETGRVVVTALHSFATPLIRYEIGDYAEVGGSCACGRGLPVLKNIAGRARNMFIAADGARYWPSLKIGDMFELAPIRQAQVVQRAHDHVEARLVVDAPLDSNQENRLRAHLHSRLPVRVNVSFAYVNEIPKGPSGKFEDFVSEVDAA